MGELRFEAGDMFKQLIDMTRAKQIVDEVGSVVAAMEAELKG